MASKVSAPKNQRSKPISALGKEICKTQTPIVAKITEAAKSFI